MLLTRRTLAERWGVSPQTVDRLRQAGKLPWLDLSAGQGRKPLVRFSPTVIEDLERNGARSNGSGR